MISGIDPVVKFHIIASAMKCQFFNLELKYFSFE
jgi:hypothetical protein